MRHILFLFVALLCVTSCKPTTKITVPLADATIDESNMDGSEVKVIRSDTAAIDGVTNVNEKSYHEDFKGKSLTGHFRYMADAAVFTPCGTTKNYPVAMGTEEYMKMERAYSNSVVNGGDPCFVEFLGEMKMAPNEEEGRPDKLTVYITKLIEVMPDRECE